MKVKIFNKVVLLGLVTILSVEAFAEGRGRQASRSGCNPPSCVQGRKQAQQVDRGQNRQGDRQLVRGQDRQGDRQIDRGQNRKDVRQKDRRHDNRKRNNDRLDRRDDRRDYLGWDRADRSSYRQIARRVNRRDNRRDHRQAHRNHYNHRYGHVVLNIALYASHSYWSNYYRYWYVNLVRPIYYAPSIHVNYTYSMPSPGVWSYDHVINVSDNLEVLSKKIFDNIDYELKGSSDVGVRDAYYKVMLAAENFADAVYEGDFMADSLYELFYLNETLDKAQNIGRGQISKSLKEKIRLMEYYVDELQWVYRSKI